ncbi:MAG: Nicotinate-nucleotide adenylyltransferase [Thermoleophilia bacterium]|nr:Nicotinate-nucleotide adenylyltransferase [Thermoleophilia bacterium]
MMNPPHLGHLALVDAVHEACALDRVVVVPAGIPPHRGTPTVSARARLTMAVRAFADLPHVVVSDTEVDRGEHGEPGYMVDTVEEVLELPAMLGYDDLLVEPVLVVGADQAAALPKWHRWEHLRDLARIAVVRRPDQLADAELDDALDRLREGGARIDLVDMPTVPISSTLVREVAARRDAAGLRQLVPEAIIDDVLRLYGPDAD